MTAIPQASAQPVTFYEALQRQRWDDHRFYHHSRVNQTLHLISALSFIAAYLFIFIDPVVAACFGWLVSMATRQSGHFFFEPRGFDEVNKLTHEHKESIKVGYNLRRKIVLLSAWALTPLVPWLSPTLFGLYRPWTSAYEFAHHLSVLWIALGVLAVFLRTGYLCATVNVRHGLVWATKILTDPFHDTYIYYKAPYYLLKGQLLDPMTDWTQPMRRH
ncbi:MAG TPA: hypothetical protein VN380_14055 [Thermoanaerobaculia bacterium]|jgi:hypothetical protein|nr:hypothetical protein [Thermoanaerobaculia bacterium]